MSHGDLYCRNCDNIIADEYYSAERYRCSQDRKKYVLLDKAFLKHIQKNCVAFDDKGDIMKGNLPKDKKILREFREIITDDLKAYLKGGIGRFLEHSVSGQIYLRYDFKKRRIWWSQENKYDKENYRRAGLVKHEVKRGYPEYGFCEECAKKLEYKCNFCNSPLLKV